MSMAIDEQGWWKDNPEPQVTETADRLVLWNYPIGKTELAASHERAIQPFLAVFVLDPKSFGSAVSVCGHASASGEAAANAELARARAENVAKHLRSLGFKGSEVTSSGSSQPADPAANGQALARNRRVELTKSTPTPVIPARVSIDDRRGSREMPPKPTGAAVSFEYDTELPLGTVTTESIQAVFTAIVKMKGRVIRGDSSVAAGLSAKQDGVSAKFEAKLIEQLKGKVGIEPGKNGVLPTAKVSLAGEIYGFPVEEGFQTSLHFIFIKATLKRLPLPELDLGTAVVSLEIDLEVKIEIGPSPQLIARKGAAAVAAAGSTGAAVAGAAIVTIVIIGGTIYATAASKEKMARLVVDVAERDGAAARVAFEALGATLDARVPFESHRLTLGHAGGKPSLDGFDKGSKTVREYLDSLRGKRNAKIEAWTETYAKNANATDFDVVQKRVVDLLDAYKNDPKPLRPLIEAL